LRPVLGVVPIEVVKRLTYGKNLRYRRGYTTRFSPEVLVTHANAPLTPVDRLRLARAVVDDGWPTRRAAERFQVSSATASKWASRYRVGRSMGDVSSRRTCHRRVAPNSWSNECFAIFDAEPAPHRLSLGDAAFDGRAGLSPLSDAAHRAHRSGNRAAGPQNADRSATKQLLRAT